MLYDNTAIQSEDRLEEADMKSKARHEQENFFLSVCRSCRYDPKHLIREIHHFNIAAGLSRGEKRDDKSSKV